MGSERCQLEAGLEECFFDQERPPEAFETWSAVKSLYRQSQQRVPSHLKAAIDYSNSQAYTATI